VRSVAIFLISFVFIPHSLIDSPNAHEKSLPPPLVPTDLLYAIWAQFEYMAAYQQQDAHEFLVALLDGISTHMHKHHGVNCTVLQHFMPVGNGVSQTEEDAANASYYSTGKFKFHGVINEVTYP
jgi:uncharacterized UBP type Zn finger protein